jgi:Tfp pilus assembly protein PilW
MAKWERVQGIAKDIIAWCDRDARRFKVEINAAVGTKIINGYISGVGRYLWFGESTAEMPLKEIYKQFFENTEAVVNMVRALAEAVAELAEKQIEELQ